MPYDNDGNWYQHPGKDYVEPCYYCGAPANSVDHVIPRALLRTFLMLDDDLVKQELYERHNVKIVNACKECNSALGSHYFPTLEERRAFIKRWLKRRHIEVLRTPQWTERELHELEPNLQGYVRSSLDEQMYVTKRLRHRGQAPRKRAHIDRPQQGRRTAQVLLFEEAHIAAVQSFYAVPSRGQSSQRRARLRTPDTDSPSAPPTEST